MTTQPPPGEDLTTTASLTVLWGDIMVKFGFCVSQRFKFGCLEIGIDRIDGGREGG